MVGSDDQFVFAAVADERRRRSAVGDAEPVSWLGCQDGGRARGEHRAGRDAGLSSDGLPVREPESRDDKLARRRAQAPIAEIVAALREHAERPVSSPIFGPRGPLADILVHSGGVRIPLGLPFEPDVQHTVSAMDFSPAPGRSALCLCGGCTESGCPPTI